MGTANVWGIPDLREDRLFDRVPRGVFTGQPDNPPQLFLWRSVALEKARGHVIGFYRWDSFFESVWRYPQRYTDLFLRHEVAAVIECDFSLWVNDPLAVQVYNVFRSRWLGRLWQEHGLPVIPNLNWAGPDSYEFCFLGVPKHAPVVAVECRTAGQTDEDRRAFLKGLREGARQIQPANVIVYGGQEHAFWLQSRLPMGPRYVLIESWSQARNRKRRQAARKSSQQQQTLLRFTESEEEVVWAAEGAVAASSAAPTK
jgi:hypothetical protein